MSALAILEVMLAHPSWSDRHLSRAERIVALAPLAVALDEETSDSRMLAKVLSVIENESGMATIVIRGGDCSQLPKGQRCDNGAARGFGQLHESACREAYRFKAGTEESIRAEVHCVVGLLRGGEARCGSLAGAYAMYGTGHSCEYRGAARRVATARRMFVELKRAELEVQQAAAKETENAA